MNSLRSTSTFGSRLAGLLLVVCALSALPASAREPVDSAAAKKFGNRHRNSEQGVLLTPGVNRGKKEAVESQEYLQGVVDELAGPLIQERGIHVRVNIYSSVSPNAFATRPKSPEGEQWTLHRFLGYAEDGKPIYELGVLQGMYPRFQNKDEIAFLLGHELGHILSGHTEPKEGLEEAGAHWYSSQAHEVEADFFSLKLMKGKYDLEAGYDFMERLLKGAPELGFYREFLSTHHHASVRLSALLSRILQLRRSESDAAPRPRTPLPEGAIRASSGGRDTAISANYEEYHQEFFKWFDVLIAPRSEPLAIYSSLWKAKTYPILAGESLRPDGTRKLFAEALRRVLAADGLSRTEKMERIFEILGTFNHSLQTARDSMSSEPSMNYLGDAERSLLNSAIKKIGFSSRDPIDLKALEALFESRTKLYNWRNELIPTAKGLHSLVRSLGVGSVFERLGKASPKWKSWMDSLEQLDMGKDLRGFVQVLDSAIPYPPTGDRRTAILSELERASISEVYGHEDGLWEAQAVMNLKLKAEGKCKDPGLCKAILSLIERNESEYKRRLAEAMHRILAKNPEQLSVEETSSAINELNFLFSSKLTRHALDPKDVEADIGRIWSWFGRAEVRVRGHYDHRRVSSGELLTTLAEPLGWGLMRGKWSKEESTRIYRRLSQLLGSAGKQDYLGTLAPAEVKAMLFEPLPDPLSDSVVMKDLCEVTGLSPEEIRKIGVTEALLDKVRQGRTEDQILAHLNAHNEPLERLGRFSRMETSPAFARAKNLLGDSAVNQRVLKGMSATELLALTEKMRKLEEMDFVLSSMRMPGVMTADQSWLKWRIFQPYDAKASDLLTTLIDLQERGVEFRTWSRTLENVLRFQRFEVNTIPLERRQRLARFLDQNLERIPAIERIQWLERPELLKLLPADRATEHLARGVAARLSMGASVSQKSEAFVEVRERLKLKEDYPELNRIFESKTAEVLKIQPGQLREFFPPHSSEVEWSQFSTHIRGASGIVGQVQKQPIPDQIEFVDYILGHSAQVPSCVAKISSEVAANLGREVNFDDLVTLMRSKLAGESSLVRSLSVLPFFVGEHSLTGQQAGTDALLAKILKAVSPANQTLALELAKGILTAEGKSGPMAFAMLLGQRSERSGPLNEGEVMKALFQAYGVPGTKFGQYLAFSSELSALSSLQDNALPLSYLEVVQMLETRFPEGLPDGFKILGVKGSGSVNIGVEYYDPKTGKNEVLSVPRDAVELGAREDFRRLRRVFEVLTRTPEGEARYGFMLGLDDVIHKSVELEFDRAQVFKNHLELSQILDRKIDGWKIKMVEPYRVENGVIFMQKAEGIPATALETQDPATYRKALKAASTAMTEHLLQEDGAKSHYADSDFHNGQVFVERKTKTVYLIDPGQSVRINEREYELGKRLLRLLSGMEDLDRGVAELNRSIINPHPGKDLVNVEDVRALLKGRTTADAFIKLVSLLSNRGGGVPLPVVQWVLGMNRQLVLRQKVGSPLSKRLFARFLRDTFRDLIVERKVGCLKDVARMVRTAAGL